MVNPDYSMDKTSSDLQVLVLDAETRHIPREEAYRIVYRVVQDALVAGFTHIYKKTDSGLRGNIGAELAAAMDAAGVDRMPFLPALPAMNRITRQGIHYIDGIPVAESVFGQDPFEPTTVSSVEEIIHQQCDVPVVLRSLGGSTEMDVPGIHLFDAETQEDLEHIGSALGTQGIWVSAGCAGFGTVVASLLIPPGERATLPELDKKLIVVCGSVNAVTLRQMAEAEKAGFTHIHLTPAQKLDAAWVVSEEKKATIAKWLELASDCCILDVNDPTGCDDTIRYTEEKGLSVEYRRQQISTNLAILVKDMLDGGLEGTILCTGGDTLLALMKQVNVSELIPVGELAAGVVLTQFIYNGKTYNIISKSGGFGEPDLFIKLAK